MAEPVRLGTLNPDNLDSINSFDRVIQSFEPGELGQIDLPLDPEIAADQEYNDFLQATNHLNNELYRMGLTEWPGLDRIAILMWRERIVRILFQATQTSAYPYSRTPSVIFAAPFFFLLTRAGTRMATSAAFRNFARTRGLTLTEAATAAGRIRNLQQSKLAYRGGVRARTAGYRGVSLPSLKFMVIGGTLLFFAIAQDQAIAVFKWPLDKAKERIIDPTLDALAGAAEKVAGAAGKGILLALGGVLVIGGVWIMLKPKVGL